MGSVQLKPGRRLHVGGTCRCEGWEVLNAIPGPAVDHVGNAKDLTDFASESIAAIYASHVLEHFDYVNEIDAVLSEWFRVLKPGGQLFISVPDLETLAHLFIDKNRLSEDDRFLVTRMMFGGHIDSFDYHQSGLSEEILFRYLRTAGFGSIERVDDFGIFNDTSTLELKGIPISLNVLAIKPSGMETVRDDRPSLESPPRAPESPPLIPCPQEPKGVPSSSWSHGYYTGASYTSGFYVELTPHRLDFSALVSGQRPPRPQSGAEFCYLELGSGTGFGLCLLAAAHPEGSFVGVDFLPGHIAHSQWLARALGLENVRFLEADFLDLCKDARPLEPTGPSAVQGFHYVVAHGIATWVSTPVQQALLSLASSQLRPGGLFYCSYNTYPGWLGRSTYHMLSSLERRINNPGAPLQALQRARLKLKNLLGGSMLERSLPILNNDLNHIHTLGSTAYLLGEYASESWAPLYVAQMHERCQEHKLTFLGSATLPELFIDLLPESSRSIVAEETNLILQQALFDLAINQSFRRDIFIKGELPLRKHQREQFLTQLLVTQISTLPPDRYRITTGFSEVELDKNLITTIESALCEGPCSIGDLCLASGRSLDDLLHTLALLIHSGSIDLHRGEAEALATGSGLAVNRRLRDLMQEGHDYSFLVASATGSVVSFSPLEALVLETIEQGLDEDTATSCVMLGLEAIGGQLTDSSGGTISNPLDQMEAVRRFLKDFRSNRVPQLRQLGAIPAS